VKFSNRDLFPFNTDINESGHLSIGGCDVVDLVSKYKTPLYIFDEDTIQRMCSQFVNEFGTRYRNVKVVYACKAFINPVLASLMGREGLGLDVVSGGELAVAKRVSFNPDDIYFHGNNKSPEELEMALDYGVKTIVVDSFYELDLLSNIAFKKNLVQNIMLRLSPSVDPHTHSYTTTGILDSKFGFSIQTGDASMAIRKALKTKNLNLTGIHFHLGSPIFELEPYAIAIDTVLTYLAQFKDEGLNLLEFSPGGGFAIGYVRDELPPAIADYAEVISTTLLKRSTELGFGIPKLIIEPGRSLIGRAGVAIYTVGATKNIPSIRKYVSVDGGMGDNIRPALYESLYEAVSANKMMEEPTELVTLAGKFCESGDILVKDVNMPFMGPGDLVAIPASGAYAPSMASNYNLNPKPAIIMVKDGHSDLIRRRETFEDMMLCDII